MEFVCPAHWPQKLRIYETPDDQICLDDDNVNVVLHLVLLEQAEQLQLRSGGHRLQDYATMDGLGDLIRFANAVTH